MKHIRFIILKWWNSLDEMETENKAQAHLDREERLGDTVVQMSRPDKNSYFFQRGRK